MNMNQKQSLYKSLLKAFGKEASPDQDKALKALSKFCLSLETHEVFMLKGYAGTGKTSLLISLVNSLSAFKRKSVLLAPTGRAAKVMSLYSRRAAFTIHKYIYHPKRDKSGRTSFTLKQNKAVSTIYFVDEASMIQDQGNDGISQNLLSDLIKFVNAGINCKLILIGDIAQLPPVGADSSPALQADHLFFNYKSEVQEVLLKQIMRQAVDSTILVNATEIRNIQESGTYSWPKFKLGPDFIRLEESLDVEGALQDAFSTHSRDEVAILVRSNKRANLYNQQIRSRILWQENELSVGDHLMVVKNNYHWLSDSKKTAFIANGDVVELLRIYDYHNLYGKRFAQVQVKLIDYSDEAPFECYIMLDTLNLEAASISWEESQKFYQTVLEDYAEIPQKYKRHQKVQENPFFNALQIKFSYAITCHKAQGGQWEEVFIEKPWLPTGEYDLESLRWLYTAITRAKSKIYLLGFEDTYFK